MWTSGSGNQNPENTSFENNAIMVTGETVLESNPNFNNNEKGFKITKTIT